MARYWCGWCGETAIAPSGLDVPCRRCTAEFTTLFGYPPRTSMDELAAHEEPGVPAAARKRFTFYDARSGEVIGTTAAAPEPKKRRQRGVHPAVTPGTPAGNTTALPSRERKEDRWTC